MVRKLLIAILLPTFFALVFSGTDGRNGKVLSLFNIVTFKNEVCASKTTTDSRNGTCYTSTECTNKGGTASGNCAAGFGVCCLFTISAGSSSSSENNTYIQNPGYPSVYSSTTALTYTIKKCSSDICTVRLDFEAFTTVGPTTTAEYATTAATDLCADSFVLSGSSGLSSPNICGVNAGQHLYMDIGNGATDQATIAFTFSTTTSTIRTWDIRVSQIQCGAVYEPPSGCLQYHTGLTGYFKTFNYDASVVQHLSDQDYSVCIRQEAGHCCIRYGTCGGVTLAFSLGTHEDGTPAAIAGNQVGSACTEDHVSIVGVTETCAEDPGQVLVSRICGTFGIDNTLASFMATTALCDCSAPFRVGIYTDATADPGIEVASSNKGACLTYTQVPCSA